MRACFATFRIGVARIGDALWQAVEGKQQVFAAAIFFAPDANGIGHGHQPARIGGVVVDHAHRQSAAIARQHVGDGRRRRRRILRIQRQRHHALDALRFQPVQHRLQRRLAVAHGVDHAHCRQVRLHGSGQALRIDRQRRAFGQPDPGVLGRRLGSAQRQDHEVQQRAPQPARQLHHAAVVQEFRQVTPHRPGRWCLRCAQIDDNHGLRGRCARGGK